MPACVSSRCFGFLPQTEHMQARLTAAVWMWLMWRGQEAVNVSGNMSLNVSAEIHWLPVQVVPTCSPSDSLDELLHPSDLTA